MNKKNFKIVLIIFRIIAFAILAPTFLNLIIIINYNINCERSVASLPETFRSSYDLYVCVLFVLRLLL